MPYSPYESYSKYKALKDKENKRNKSMENKKSIESRTICDGIVIETISHKCLEDKLKRQRAMGISSCFHNPYEKFGFVEAKEPEQGSIVAKQIELDRDVSKRGS